MEFKLEEVAREGIKPDSASDPNTHHDDVIQLSLVDISCPPTYVSAVFFYNNIDDLNSEIISQKLKASLSQTLSRFYPLAGQIKDASIICNNEGAVFTEARTHLLLSDFLKALNIESLQKLFPTTAPEESPTSWPLITVKVSFFGSGSGVAVAVCVSHLICDAASMFTFVSDWAATTKGKSNDHMVNRPQFASTTIYPPPHISFQVPKLDSLTEFSEKCVTNRFVFEASKIAELKAKAASETVAVPSRVEVISALIWKCATKASPRSNWSSLINQAMDLRPRIPSAKDAIGNLLTFFFLKKEPGSNMEIDQIVKEFRKGKEEVNEMIKESDTPTTLTQNLMKRTVDFMLELKPQTHLYGVTSWCNKPFYEVDFGMGGPVWIGCAAASVPATQLYVLLMDAKNEESVEAWIGLPEEDMDMFLRDQELLAYATLNPSIII